MRRNWLILALALVSPCAFAQSGPYSPGADALGSNAIYKDSTIIESWAQNVEIVRGLQDHQDASIGYASFGIEADATGVADEYVVSLGDGGYAIYTLAAPIANTDGPDIAVFENSFSDYFLELATVSISSDGANYFAFPATSLTSTDVQVGSFDELDPTNLYNLAGKYRKDYGTPFDFQELESIDGLNINAVTHIKIQDVIGDISSDITTLDANGNTINDPYPTPFPSSGFDLDALAIIGSVNNINEIEDLSFDFYPNPCKDRLVVQSKATDIVNMSIVTLEGKMMMQQSFVGNTILDTSDLPKGLYLVKVTSSDGVSVKKLIKG